MKKPKIIFFDWYKTLSNSLFWDHLEAKDPEKYALINHSFLKTHSNLINPWMRGEYSAEDICNLISTDTKLDDKYVLNELKLSAQNMSLINPEILDLIKKLKANNVSAVIATDNMDTFTRWTAPRLKLDKTFDDILNSWELKALKSDFENAQSKFFGQYLKYNNVKPEECILIDDSEDKGSRIANLGIKYFQIKEPKEVNDLIVSLFSPLSRLTTSNVEHLVDNLVLIYKTLCENQLIQETVSQIYF